MRNELDFIVYTEPDGDIKVRATIANDTIWLTQKAMSELFGVNAPAISKNLDNIYENGELVQGSTISKMEIVQDEGDRNWTVLEGKGKVSHKMGLNKAHKEYDEFNKVQKIISYFDKKLLDEN